jgi:hypothetical protein
MIDVLGGMWLQVEYLEASDDHSQVGVLELCHAQDIVRIITPSS